MIDNLGKRIEESLTMNFREFSGHKGVKTKEEKVFVIVSFLAMLELVRQGIVDVIQSANFDEIEMKRLEKSMEEFMDDREANEAVE
jgi:chromatin segregation and condensation protein Rec8/ScpA/Scc1 (kleisin family)